MLKEFTRYLFNYRIAYVDIDYVEGVHAVPVQLQDSLHGGTMDRLTGSFQVRSLITYFT
jgi:hypothetical protein